MSSKDFKAFVLALLRSKMYETVISECAGEISRRGNEPFLQYFRAFGLGMSGQASGGIRELEALQCKRDMSYPASIMLLFFHRRSKMVDIHEISTIESTLSTSESSLSDQGTLLSAMFYFFTENFYEARRMCGKVASMNGVAQNPVQVQANTLSAWIEMLDPESGDGARNDAVGLLEDQSMARDLDCLMAKAKYYEKQGRKKLALDQLNEAIALQSWFTPALSEKSKMFMSSGEWEQANEMAQRVLNTSNSNSNYTSPNFEAILLLALCDIVFFGKTVEDNIETLFRSIQEQEHDNASIHFSTSRLFARLSGRKRDVLQYTIKMMKVCCDMEPMNSKFYSELAFQYRLEGNYGTALDTYRDASKYDESNVDAIYGSIYCQIMQGSLEDAEQQLEFLSVVQDGATQPSSDMLFMQALLANRKEKDGARHLDLLADTLDARRREHKGSPPNGILEEYVQFNPDFMVELAKEYLQHLHSPTSVMTGSSSDEVPPAVLSGLEILENCTNRVPALLDAHLVIAKANFEMKKLDKTQQTLNHCIDINPSHSDTYLAMAQLHLAKDNFRSANNCLEQAMSYDFKIRNSPIFQLVKSECLANQGALDEAKTQLEDAMKLPGVRDGLTVDVSLSDRVSIFVQLAGVYARLNMISEANEVLNEGKAAFEGSVEQIRILVAISDLAIKKNDFTSAINMLNSVPTESSLYTHAVVAKADIYLKHRHDKQAFAQCYLELVQAKKSAATYVLLGEAYMRIQAPESAIDAFESALRYNPQDSRLAEKIGKALVSTHDYMKAQDYYENALRNMPDNIGLRYDMAKLFTKLQNYDRAAKTLKKVLSGLDEGDEGKDALEGVGAQDLKMLTQDVETLLLLVEVYKGSGDSDIMKETLLRARAIQKLVMDMSRGQGESKSSQAKIGSKICYALAKVAEEENDDSGAIEFYQEALDSSVHEASMMSLSKMYLRKHNLDECEEMTQTLLRVASAKEEATMVMGDLMFLKSDFENATVQYRNLLAKNPNNYVALEKLVSLMRRAGKLDEVPELFENAEKADPRSSSHSGLFFAKGMYYRYTNSIMDAIKNFNLIRRDGEWGGYALENMIEVYINPDGANMWEEAEGGGEGNSESVRVAEKLLRELELLGPKKKKHVILENFHLLATRQKANIDRAMASFLEILETDKEYLPALFGVSMAFMFEKASNKSRNYLKRIAKMPYNQEFADEFEKSYLMLAEIYVGRGKFDLAQELCKKCLGYNKSCAGAWDLMGVIMEKEQSYKDAAECYEKSWKFEHEASASIGFKLAFNYLKAKRYVEAIDISNKVLAQYPDYPKIRTEILQRAMESLRP